MDPAHLLVTFALVFQPAIHMTALWIMVGPVDHPTPLIPLVLTVEADTIAFTQVRNPWRQIDVVRDQKGLAGGQLQNSGGGYPYCRPAAP